METKAERRIRFILDHIVNWENLPREAGHSFFEPKICQLRFTPYQKQRMSAATRFLMLAVLDRLIAFEDGQVAANDEANTDNAMEVVAQSIYGDKAA